MPKFPGAFHITRYSKLALSCRRAAHAHSLTSSLKPFQASLTIPYLLCSNVSSEGDSKVEERQGADAEVRPGRSATSKPTGAQLSCKFSLAGIPKHSSMLKAFHVGRSNPRHSKKGILFLAFQSQAFRSQAFQGRSNPRHSAEGRSKEGETISRKCLAHSTTSVGRFGALMAQLVSVVSPTWATLPRRRRRLRK